MALGLALGFGGYLHMVAVSSLVDAVRSQSEQIARVLLDGVDEATLQTLQTGRLSQFDQQRLEQRLRLLVASSPEVSRLALIRAGESEPLAGSVTSTERVPLGTQLQSWGWEGQLWGSPDTLVNGMLPVPGLEGIQLSLDVDMTRSGERLMTLRLSAALALLVALLAAVALSRLLAGRILGAIRALIQRCRSLAERGVAEPLELSTADEFDQLIEAVNTLSSRLQQTSEQRERALEDLRQSNVALADQVRLRASELDRANALLRDEVEHRLRAEAMIAEAAVTDPLTGLLNRRGMMEILQRASENARASGRPLALAVADVDHFKRINDTLGHETGDRVLEAVARLLRDNLGGDDIAARWGGEEFLLLWVDCNLPEAALRADHLRCQISAKPLVDRTSTITISVGVTHLLPSDDLDRLIARADTALYQAKRSGRNQVVSDNGRAPRQD